MNSRSSARRNRRPLRAAEIDAALDQITMPFAAPWRGRFDGRYIVVPAEDEEERRAFDAEWPV